MSRRRRERKSGSAKQMPTVRHYEMDGPRGSFVIDKRIGMRVTDVEDVLAGGATLDRLNRTYRLVAAIAEKRIAEAAVSAQPKGEQT